MTAVASTSRGSATWRSQRNVASQAALAAMSDDEVVDLIFAPGFSTASEVTDLSGRGVGMDVVRTTIERLGGQVAVSSRPRRGTTVRFTLPFTVMMTQVLTVEAAGQVFGVPMDAVVETVRVDRKAIAPVGAARAMVLRNRTLPVIDLARALGRGPGASAGDANVLIVSIAGQWGGLEVDRLGEPTGRHAEAAGGPACRRAGHRWHHPCSATAGC